MHNDVHKISSYFLKSWLLFIIEKLRKYKNRNFILEPTKSL